MDCAVRHCRAGEYCAFEVSVCEFGTSEVDICEVGAIEVGAFEEGERDPLEDLVLPVVLTKVLELEDDLVGHGGRRV